MAIKRTTASGKKRIAIVKSSTYINRPSNVTKKKPSPRLKSRRASNTVKGRFPNPINEYLKKDAQRLIAVAIKNTKKSSEPNTQLEKIRLQAAISYAQGAIDMAHHLRLISGYEYDAHIQHLASLVK